jgi:hypothetical protein
MVALLVGTLGGQVCRGKLEGDRLPASSSHETVGLTKITIVAAKRPGSMISTVAQQPAVVSIAVTR